MSALHDPSLGLHHEALGDDLGPHEIERLLRVLPGACAAVAGVAHHLDADAVGLLDAAGALAPVGGVGVQLLQAGDLGAGVRDDLSGRVAILHAGGGDGDGQQQAQRIDHQMTFASQYAPTL